MYIIGNLEEKACRFIAANLFERYWKHTLKSNECQIFLEIELRTNL